MLLELSPTAGLVAFVATVVLAALVGLALVIAVLVDAVARHRPVRRRRRQSIPAYYGLLLTSP